MYNKTLGKLHFWGTLIFFSGIFIPLFYNGLMGQHRRIADFSAFDDMMVEPLTTVRVVATVSLICLLLTQFIFIYNMFSSLLFGKKAGSNPWKSPTLEWQTVSPPPHGNFKEYPTVYRDAYDYENSRDGEDFIPQNVK